MDEHIRFRELERGTFAVREDSGFTPRGQLRDDVRGGPRSEQPVGMDAHTERASVELRRVQEDQLAELRVDAVFAGDIADGLRERLERAIGGRLGP